MSRNRIYKGRLMEIRGQVGMTEEDLPGRGWETDERDERRTGSSTFESTDLLKDLSGSTPSETRYQAGGGPVGRRGWTDHAHQRCGAGSGAGYIRIKDEIIGYCNAKRHDESPPDADARSLLHRWRRVQGEG